MLDIIKTFQKKIKKNFQTYDVISNDVINFLEFYSYSVWILRMRFYRLTKTGNYVKQQPFSFKKIKTELKNLYPFSFDCDFKKGYFLTGQRYVKILWWRHQPCDDVINLNFFLWAPFMVRNIPGKFHDHSTSRSKVIRVWWKTPPPLGYTTLKKAWLK